MKLITQIENKIYAHPIMVKISSHPLGRRFLTDMLFRTKLSMCCIIIAAVNSVKYRSCGSPVISAAKAIILTVALISVLSFETAAVTRFGNEKNEAILKAVVGTSCGAVCVIVLTMAIIMTVRGTKQIKLLTGNSQNKKGDEIA